MEKKFKHRTTGEIATYKDGVLKSSGFCVEIGVEPGSEFWEEVIKRDFEILSWYFGDMNITTNPDGSAREYFIHSIKRLSDGEVFTIGDWVDGHIKQGKIRKIIIAQNLNRDVVSALSDKKYKNTIFFCVNSSIGNIPLEQAIKPKPLFTTEDGYVIFSDDLYYYVDEEDFSIYEGLADQSSGKAGFKYFKEKTNAEWYIFQNKPVLSLKDVQSIYVSAKPGYKKNGVEQEYYDKLCKLIKSK